MKITFSSGLTLSMSDRLYASVLEQVTNELVETAAKLESRIEMLTDTMLGIHEADEGDLDRIDRG